jgi:hypothetical protein
MEYIFKGENILEFIKQLVMYQTCCFCKNKIQNFDYQYKIKIIFNRKGDQMVAFFIFARLKL